MSELKASMVPDVLDRLVEIGETATPDDWSVFDGPFQDMDTRGEYLLIGWSGQPDTRGTEVDMADAGSGGRQNEVIDVHGLVHASLGDNGQSAARRLAYSVLDAFAAAIKTTDGASPLGSRVARARLTKHAVEPYIGYGGGCAVHFTIHIEGTR